MTALTVHSTASTDRNPQQTAAALDNAVRIVSRQAEAHGWVIRRVYQSLNKRSTYIGLYRSSYGRLTVRVSDHTPAWPMQRRNAPMMLCVPGISGSLQSVLRYLARSE